MEQLDLNLENPQTCLVCVCVLYYSRNKMLTQVFNSLVICQFYTDNNK